MGNQAERGEEREDVGVIEEERAIIGSWQTARRSRSMGVRVEGECGHGSRGARSGLRLAVWPGRRGGWSRVKMRLWRQRIGIEGEVAQPPPEGRVGWGSGGDRGGGTGAATARRIALPPWPRCYPPMATAPPAG